MGRSRFTPSSTSIRLAATVALVACMAGCVSSGLVPVDPDAPIALAEDEGLLFLRVDTGPPLIHISTGDLDLYHRFDSGRTTLLLRAKAGRHSWKSVRIPSKNAFGGRYRVRRDAYNRDEELDFEIVPGRLNYAGDIVVRAGRFWTEYRRSRFVTTRSISVRVRNRAGGAIRQLEAERPALLERYGLHLAADSPDVFIEFYLAERERLRSGAASAGESGEPAGNRP